MTFCEICSEPTSREPELRSLLSNVIFGLRIPDRNIRICPDCNESLYFLFHGAKHIQQVRADWRGRR